MQLAIFGAKSTALGICKAVQALYRQFPVVCFLVSSKAGNPDMLANLPVYELGSFPRKDVCVLVATPEDVQERVVCALEARGFGKYICIDSAKEARLMERYYAKIGAFRSLHRLRQEG